MRKLTLITVLFIVSMFYVGCAPKVMVPPKVDLKGYETIGLVEFDSNSEGNFSEYVTQEFLEAISEDQAGVKVIELGTEEELLSDLGLFSMGPDALKAMNRKYDIRTLITGNIDFSEPSADINGIPGLTSMGVEVNVSAILTVKMRDAETGATIWTSSSRAEREIADVGFTGNFFHFGSENPDKAYGKLTDKLLRNATRDFRISYIRKRD
ncbi:hypothetical protein KAH81_06910 [bacterium]|nr:hypothetical protein [bacterium]